MASASHCPAMDMNLRRADELAETESLDALTAAAVQEAEGPALDALDTAFSAPRRELDRHLEATAAERMQKKHRDRLQMRLMSGRRRNCVDDLAA